MQQAVSTGTRSYLSNGRHYLFAKVGADRTKMILSSIHNPDGTIDPYDGMVHPDEWIGEAVPFHAVRATQVGHAQPQALPAIVVSSMRDQQDGNAPPAFPNDRDENDDDDTGGEDHEGGDGEGHGANSRDAGGESDNHDQPGEDPPEDNGTAGERRSERLAGQGRTRGRQTLPSSSKMCPQVEELRPLTLAKSKQVCLVALSICELICDRHLSPYVDLLLLRDTIDLGTPCSTNRFTKFWIH
jgi:hypothetical protein